VSALNDRLSVERLRPPVSLADRQAVLTIEAESFTNPWNVETFDALLNTPVSQLYVARLDGLRLAAFCACWLIDDELHINTIAVDLRLRRQGIGRRLLRDILQLTKARRATLEVRASNEAAVRLYHSLGFRTTAVRRNYYTNPVEDGLILWLNP
jgi:[ribosomal protein S18]-alanine N-acetyltransferase